MTNGKGRGIIIGTMGVIPFVDYEKGEFMKKSAAAFAAILVLFASSDLARANTARYWKGLDNDWSSGSSWTGGVAPEQDDDAYFSPSSYSSSATKECTIRMSGDIYIGRLLVYDAKGSVDGYNFVFKGPARLFLNDRNFHDLDTGSTVIFENVDVIVTNHYPETATGTGSMRFWGDVTFRGGGFRFSKYSTGSQDLNISSGGKLTITDGAFVQSQYFTHNATTGIYIDNGTFQVRGSYYSDFTSPNLVINNGLFLSEGTYPRFWTKGFIPKGTNGLAISSFPTYYVFRPDLVEGEKIPWRGTVAATNVADSGDTAPQTSFTNAVTFYGRGKFVGSRVVFSGKEGRYDFDLSHFVIGRRIESGSTVQPDVYFHDVVLGTFSGNVGRTAAGWDYSSSPRLHFCGRTVFDFNNLTVPEHKAKHTMAKDKIFFGPRSRLTIKGDCVVNSAYASLPRLMDGIEFSGGAAVTNLTSDSSIAMPFRTTDFTLGSGSSLMTSEYDIYVEALGDVSIAPDAKIVCTPYKSPGNHCWAAFVSLSEESYPDNVSMASLPSGCSLRWVGGTAFIANDVDITDYLKNAYGFWVDGQEGSDGLFSNTKNWSRNTLYKDGTINMTFSGKFHTVVTNDVDDVSVKSLCVGVDKSSYQANTAPFIVRGKPIKVTATAISDDSASVITRSQMPAIFECRIDSDQTDFTVVTYGKIVSRGGGAYLKGGVSASSARFVPSGTVVLGGQVSVRDLYPTNSVIAFQSVRGGASDSTKTTLVLKPGCRMTVSSQTSALDRDFEMTILTNAQLTVNGPWTVSETNVEHHIKGELVLNGTVGGNARQGYFGPGTLKVKTTDGSAGGTLAIGEDIVLAPGASSWGSMPIAVASDATISNDLAWTYSAAGLDVEFPGKTLTIDGSGTTELDAPVSGYDITLRKRGEGTLVLGSAENVLTNSTVEVEGGVLACAADQEVRVLRLAAGSKLAVGGGQSSVAKIAVAEEADLSGAEIVLDGESDLSGVSGWQDLVVVSAGGKIVGEPSAGQGLFTRIVEKEGGAKALQTKIRRGTLLIVN